MHCKDGIPAFAGMTEKGGFRLFTKASMMDIEKKVMK